MNVSGNTPGRFWNRLAERGDAIAVIDAATNKVLTYAELASLASQVSSDLNPTTKRLAFLCVRNDSEGILCYLGLLSSGFSVCLCGPDVEMSLKADLVTRFQPEIVVYKGGPAVPGGLAEAYRETRMLFGYRVFEAHESSGPIHPDLALLLSTSGSTGNSKMVRLSYDNLSYNAPQIADAQRLSERDRVFTTLPLQYAYGLSVLHSALSAGATVITGLRTMLDDPFWRTFQSTGATTLPLVSASLRFLRDMKLDMRTVPTLKRVTLSGSAMDPISRAWAASTFAAHNVAFYSMYGMTEATSRMTVLPPEEFAVNPTSVGRPVRYGQLSVLECGEIVYRGPNVMLGYASSRADLDRGNDTGGVLRTGDIGTLDAEGNLYLHGRATRIGKILGLRINLADIEDGLTDLGDVAVTSDDEVIRIFYSDADQSTVAESVENLARRFRLPMAALVVSRVSSIPRTASGKISYGELPSNTATLLARTGT